MTGLSGKRLLLIVSGGIAAYKTPELIRLIRKDGGAVRCILSAGGEKFVTPLTLSALSGDKVYSDLWSLTDEAEMGHIRLSREADLVVVAPATANLIGKMAHGLADDLASTALLASDKPVLICPAMNPEMWAKDAVKENMRTLERRGVAVCGPAAGDMACGETGMGRMSEPEDILAAIRRFFLAEKPLAGRTALVTSGPTYEPLDPVRFIGNRSSGKQGHAIAEALARAGASVTLISGPVALPDPPGVKTVHVETARQMLDACLATLPADIAVCAAAVADWTPATPQTGKIKKEKGAAPPTLALTENPDILATLARHAQRPALVAGFAAETENLLHNAAEKRARKGCDWILANDVASEKVFGADANRVYLISERGAEDWGKKPKSTIASDLATRIGEHFAHDRSQSHQAAE